MSKAVVHAAAGAFNSPARYLVYEAVNELVQEQLWEPDRFELPVRDTDEIIFAVSPDKDIVGVLCYRVIGDTAMIVLAYVEHSSRRQGVFTDMLNELLTSMQRRNVRGIEIDVLLANESLLGAVKKLHMSPVACRFGLSTKVAAV